MLLTSTSLFNRNLLISVSFHQFSLDGWSNIILGRQNLRMTFLSMIFSKVIIEKSVKKKGKSWSGIFKKNVFIYLKV
jgi:hypothetical protein